MAKAYLIAIALGLFAHLFSVAAAYAFGNEKIVKTVGVNSSVLVRNFYIYNSNGCRSLPPPSVDPRTPQLGEIQTKVVEIKPKSGPCGIDFKYQALRVTYKSGSVAGTDRFTLYVYSNGFTPIPVEIKVGATSAQSRKSAAKTEKQEPKKMVAVSRPADSTSNSENKNQTIVGRYVNNLGSIILIDEGFVYFTGIWNKDKVQQKPFAIKSYDGNEFEWGVYKCVGNSAEFSCSNTGREQVVLYRKLK